MKKATVVHAKNEQEWEELLESHQDSICFTAKVKYVKDKCLVISNEQSSYGTQSIKEYFEVNSDRYNLISFEEWKVTHAKPVVEYIPNMETWRDLTGHILHDDQGNSLGIITMHNNIGLVQVNNIDHKYNIHTVEAPHKFHYGYKVVAKKPEVESDKFIVGKWYKYRGWYIKFLEFTSFNSWKASEHINDDGKYHKVESCFGNLSTNKDKTLVTDLSEIQKYLPDGHPDKIAENPLPKNWCIKITEDNKTVMKEYWLGLNPNQSYGFQGWLLSNARIDVSYLSFSVKIPEGYTEITFKEFSKYILKKEIQKEDLKVGDVIYVTDTEAQEGFFMLGRVLSLYNELSDGRTVKGNADYISNANNQEKLYKNRSWCYKDSEGKRTYRKATQAEISWLDYCISKDEYFSYGKYLAVCGGKVYEYIKTWGKHPDSLAEYFPSEEEIKFKTKKKSKTIFSTFVDDNLPININLVKNKTNKK